MRTSLFAVVAPAALCSFPMSGFSQSFEIGPGGVRIDRGGGRCEQLRLACENKERLGEQGEGNCRRYRETCGRPLRRARGEGLRAASLKKEKLGEQGGGTGRTRREI